MGKNSKIEWTHHTFNPWRGCTKVSDGCKHCYAETLSGRNPATLGVWGPTGSRVIAAESYWKQPLKWNSEAMNAGERRRVFCASLADVFEGKDTMPKESWSPVLFARDRLFHLIDDTPHLDWLLLTKRPENIEELAIRSMPDNVWIGTSVESQKTADERIPHLLRVPAAVRFLSCEPLLGPVDLMDVKFPAARMDVLSGTGVATRGVGGQSIPNAWCNPVDWVIVGGESGPGARPMHPDWVRELRDQCNSAGVAFHFKQWGEYAPMDVLPKPIDENDISGRLKFLAWTSLNNRGIPFGIPPRGKDDVYKVGKKIAGRVLDGREWNEFPEVGVGQVA